MAETALIVADHSSPRKHSPPRSPSTQFSSLIMDGIFSRKSLLYNRLSSAPLRLTVLKLDGSTFDIQVAKTATIAELKDAVEAAFSHMPQKGRGKISWPHVWGQFCLCYDGQKLVTDDDYLKNYGIKDGDQLRFIRHVSNSCDVRRKRLKKQVFRFKQLRRSSSQVDSYQPDECGDDDEIGPDGVAAENWKIQHYNKAQARVGKSKLSGFVGELFSYNRLAVVRKTRTKSRIFCPSIIAKYLLGSFRKIRRIVSFGRRRHYPWSRDSFDLREKCVSNLTTHVANEG